MEERTVLLQKNVEPRSLSFDYEQQILKCYLVFFDNWFSTFLLLIQLQSMQILVLGNVHSNLITGCLLLSHKDLKIGRGGFDYSIDLSFSLRMDK